MFDGLGSERTVTNSSQTVTGTITFEGFGATIATTGSSSNPYKFAATSGYRDDGDAGLMHIGARYYDAQVGRFITRDTELDQHPYLYCDHDPINDTDPSGHDPDDKKPDPGKPDVIVKPAPAPVGDGQIRVGKPPVYEFPRKSPIKIKIKLGWPPKNPSIGGDWSPPKGGGAGGGGSWTPGGGWEVHLKLSIKYKGI